MCQQQQFQWLEVWCLIEHYASPLEVGLSKWQFNIKFQDLESLNLKMYLSILIRIKSFGLSEKKLHLSKWR
jgi:hypothetical protein